MKGKKMICERTFNQYMSEVPLIKGKAYEVHMTKYVPFNPSRPFDDDGPYFYVKNEEGEVRPYSGWILREMTEQEEREERLKELGI